MQKLYAVLLIFLIAHPVKIAGSDAPKPWIIKHENNDVSETYEEMSEHGWETRCVLWKPEGRIYCRNSNVSHLFDDWYMPYEGPEAVQVFNALKKRYVPQMQQVAKK